MAQFGKFFSRMFSEWGSALSGPASVPFAILALFASGTSQRIAYGALAILLAFVSAYRIWSREYDRAESAEKRYSDERPHVTFTVRTPRTYNEWRDLENVYPPPMFRLEHSGGRVARFLRIDPIQSRQGMFRLEFEDVPVLSDGPRCLQSITFTVYQNGVKDLSYDEKILKIQQGPSMMLSFLKDHSSDEKESIYPVHVHYRDQNGVDEFSEEFILKCQNDRFLLSIEPKPNPSRLLP